MPGAKLEGNVARPPTFRPALAGDAIFPAVPMPSPIAWTPSRRASAFSTRRCCPATERYLDLESVDAVAEAIRTLRVRGAPLIGIAAAMGVTLETLQQADIARGRLRRGAILGATRPTAVNLRWALDRMERRAAAAAPPRRAICAQALRGRGQRDLGRGPRYVRPDRRGRG